MKCDDLFKKYRKNISDIDKILDIYENNKDILNKQICKELKAKRNSYIIKLFDVSADIIDISDIISIKKMKIDYNHSSVMVTFILKDGSTYENIYNVNELIEIKGCSF